MFLIVMVIMAISTYLTIQRGKKLETLFDSHSKASTYNHIQLDEEEPR